MQRFLTSGTAHFLLLCLARVCPSGDGRASVDWNLCASYETGRRGSQKQSQALDFDRLRDSPQRNSLAHHLTDFPKLHAPTSNVRRKGTRRDRIHRNVVAREFQRHLTNKVGGAGLRSHIRRPHPSLIAKRSNGSRDDYAPTCSLFHVKSRTLNRCENGTQVHGEHFVPKLVGNTSDFAARIGASIKTEEAGAGAHARLNET
jgi:hypothetical protein